MIDSIALGSRCSEPHDRATDDGVDLLGRQVLGCGRIRSPRAGSVRIGGTRAGDASVGVAIAEVERAGSSIDVLRDADAPDPQLGIGYAVDRGEVLQRWRAYRVRRATSWAVRGASASEVASYSFSTTIGRYAILAVDSRVADAKPVLRNTGLDQPMRGVLLGRTTCGAPIPVGHVAWCIEVCPTVVTLDEQPGGHVHQRQ